MMSARDEIRSWYGVILSRAWVASPSVVKLHSPEKAELHSTQRATQPSGRSFAEGLLPLQLHVAPVQRLLVVDEENRNTAADPLEKAVRTLEGPGTRKASRDLMIHCDGPRCDPHRDLTS